MIEQYAYKLREFIGNRKPEILIILGSGLGTLADNLENVISKKYSELGFPQTAVSGHAGEVICGTLAGKEVLCMRGRFHLYEGHSPEIIKNVICAFAQVGIKKLIVTNAAGSLKTKMPAGSIMLISDHINFSGFNPLIGRNDEKYGPRFVDMSNAYDVCMRTNAKKIAEQNAIKLYEGTYLMVSGPNFETAAEIRAFQTLGADAVGMSTVPEVLAAVYAGLKVLGFSVITNLGTGLQKQAQSHAETLHQADEAASRLTKLVTLVLREE